ncbi:MAG: hypothetical protein EOO88_28410 [Pedobacter sp.]|nr:MAG: hypothetical protein EOO88_28410 [Pedobacter sp.]
MRDMTVNSLEEHQTVSLASAMPLLDTIMLSCPQTPDKIPFLSKVLQRPENEKPFLLLPIGYPAADCFVPDLKRKPLDEVAAFYDQPGLDTAK